MSGLLTISEAAERLGVHVDTLKRWECSGYIVPHYTDGGHRRYDEFEVIMLIAKSIDKSREERIGIFKKIIADKEWIESPDEAMLEMFGNYIDTFTVWHILLLNLFDDPPEWFNKRKGKTPPQFAFSSNLSEVVNCAYPQLKDKRAFYDQVWKELNDNGLVNTPMLHGMMTEAGWKSGRTTDLGKKFLQYIDSHKES